KWAVGCPSSSPSGYDHISLEFLWEDLKPNIAYLTPDKLELVHNALKYVVGFKMISYSNGSYPGSRLEKAYTYRRFHMYRPDVWHLKSTVIGGLQVEGVLNSKRNGRSLYFNYDNLTFWVFRVTYLAKKWKLETYDVFADIV
ncbi:hypothetical protein Tco_0203097, partial [Tanacetum coccineum]